MTLKFEQAGVGATRVIVIHDWLSTIRSFDTIRPYIDERAFSYAFVDMRGYGLNIGVAGTYSAAEASADVIAVADQLGWNQFHIVGHSMSGMIAQRVCLDARNRVKSLVAVAPVSASGMPLDEAGAQLFRGAASEADAWLSIANLVTSSRLPKRWYEDRMRAFRATVDPVACLGFLKMFSSTDFSAEMLGLSMPALAVLGRYDFNGFSEEAVQQSLGRWFKPFEVEIIESSGHYPMSETPPNFVRIVERFISTAE